MRKYYIPTSTLNFNNILSSESISPKTFYEKRGFGYSRWQTIPENDNENAIMLYYKAFSFNRPASDVEDHPMLIEIQTDDTLKSVADGVYYCDHTIYLSPWRTRFIFFNEHDRDVALSLSESSLETKMLRLYRQRLSVEQYPEIEWASGNYEIPLNEQGIEHDKRINKMKGLLYGYYIGALLSTTPSIVHKHNVLQELQNIFSAALSSDDHTPTIKQEMQIRYLLIDLQKELPAIAYLTKQLAEPQKINEVLAELVRLGVSFPNVDSAESIIYALTHSTEKDNQALVWLDRERDNLQYDSRTTQRLLHPDKEEIIISDGNLAKIAEDVLSHKREEELAKAWINDILSSDKYSGKISSFKSALADDVTFRAKDVYGDQWNGSEAKVALNNMRRYVSGNESEFQWNNLQFSSIAAVIAKGNDWERLLAFLQSKDICDYRLAFAFYGELNGFANLTRDFTDLLLNEDSKYVASVYKEFAGQLLGVDVTADISSDNPMPTNEQIMDEMHQADRDTDIQTWRQDAEAYIREKASSKKNLETAIEILCDTSISTAEDFISCLKQQKGWKKGTIFNGLRDLLLPHEKGGETKKGKWESDNQPSLGLTFDEEITSDTKSNISSPISPKLEEKDATQRQNSMYENRDWWKVTANMVVDTRAHKQYLADVEWFIGNHENFYNDKKKGRIKGYYSGHPTENVRLLERFHTYLQNKIKPNPRATWIAKEYAKVPIEEIIQYLTSWLC